MAVPVWAWMNVLAHGGAGWRVHRRPNRLRQAGRDRRIARAYLAFEILDRTDAEFPLVNLQSSGLIPLEAETAMSTGRWKVVPGTPGVYEVTCPTQRSTVRASAGRGRMPARSTRSWNSLRSNRSPRISADAVRRRTISRRPTM